MNAKMRRLQKREIVVVTLCVAFLISTLGAVGQSGRQRAKEVVCQANLHQWDGVFLDYIGQNNGKFLSGCNANGYWWPMQLTFEQQDRKSNRTWFCPTATTPIQDEHGVTSAPLTTHDAWGIFYGPGLMTYQGKTYSMNPNGIAGSFGLNGYTLDTPETGIYAASRWGDLLNVPHANSVPMFIDALRFDLWPLHTDSPASTEVSAWTGNSMARCCINRHDGAVNCLFVDGSVRKVGLKELWTLKWHKSFNTAGPWTQAGGVRPKDWPEWIEPFKDY